jgi:hypothetical protein
MRVLVLAAGAWLLACNAAAAPAAERPQLRLAPQLAAPDAQRLQALQRELAAARERTRSDAAAVAQLRAQVEEAQQGQAFASRLATGLGVVLALLLAWLAWRWYRLHQVERVSRWFAAQRAPAADVEDIPFGPEEDWAPRPAVPPPPANPAAPATPVTPVTPAEPAGRGTDLRTADLQELIDVHDKADFFLSIGEPGQAVGLLEAHVREVETGALAWLDLLELYHRLGERGPYSQLRSEFRRRFTAQVPEFDRFAEATPSLESYSRALSRIVDLWPTQRVLDVIEESIFRKPGQAGAEPFSLEAYRELVLLYHVARDLGSPQPDAQEGEERPAPSGTRLQPLNELDAQEATQAERERLMIPPASPHLGVDIDLDEPAAPLDFDVSAWDEAEPTTRKRV